MSKYVQILAFSQKCLFYFIFIKQIKKSFKFLKCIETLKFTSFIKLVLSATIQYKHLSYVLKSFKNCKWLQIYYLLLL